MKMSIKHKSILASVFGALMVAVSACGTGGSNIAPVVAPGVAAVPGVGSCTYGPTYSPGYNAPGGYGYGYGYSCPAGYSFYNNACQCLSSYYGNPQVTGLGTTPGYPTYGTPGGFATGYSGSCPIGWVLNSYTGRCVLYEYGYTYTSSCSGAYYYTSYGWRC